MADEEGWEIVDTASPVDDGWEIVEEPETNGDGWEIVSEPAEPAPPSDVPVVYTKEQTMQGPTPSMSERVARRLDELKRGYYAGAGSVAHTLANITQGVNAALPEAPDVVTPYLRRQERSLTEAAGPAPRDLTGKVLYGIGSAAAEIPGKYAPAVALGGPVLGMGGVESIGSADQGPAEAAKAGIKGAAMGTMLKVAGGMQPIQRTAATATTGGAFTAAEGGQPEDIASSAIVMGALGLGPREIGVMAEKPFKALARMTKGTMEDVETLPEQSRPKVLGAFTVRQLGEMAGHPELKRFADVASTIAADVNMRLERAAPLAERLARYGNKEKLADVIYDSTISRVDPTEEYIPGATKHELEALRSEPVTPETRMEIRDIKRELQEENSRRDAYERVKKDYDELDDEGKAIYNELRDSYRKMWDEEFNILSDNIEKSDIPDEAKADLHRRLAEAHTQALRGPYFPLSRFGDYWVSAKDENGEPVFRMMETAAEQKRAVKELRELGYGEIKKGKKLDTGSFERIMPESVKQVEETITKRLGDTEEAKELIDDVRQMYIKSLPDVSIQKARIHRKGTAGYSRDLLRTYANRMFHGAKQLARLKHDRELKSILSNVKTEIRNSEDSGRLTDYYNEFQKRYDWLKNPKASRTAQRMNRFGFFMYLAASPAAAAVNLLQTPMVALPVLGARFGFAKAGNELVKAGALAARPGGLKKANLSRDERRAIDTLEHEGVVERTQAHSLAEMAESPRRLESTRLNKAVDLVMSWMFNRAEVWNREATALAAYRMARKAGRTHEEAVDEARDLTYKSHFDYSNYNRPRWFQGDVARVVTQFKQYSQQMTYLLGRSLYEATKESPEVRAEARRRLLGILGMTALIGGVEALPVVDTVIGTLNAVHALFGDKDEPFDAYAEFRAGLIEAFKRLGMGEGQAKKAGAIVARGGSELTGADLTSRVGLGELWWRRPGAETTGRELVGYAVEQLLGPSMGTAGRFARSYDLARRGLNERAVEAVMPKAARAPMQAYRYSKEGVTTTRGDELVPPEEITTVDAVLQAIGFTPEKIAERYAENQVVRDLTEQARNRRRILMDAFDMAERTRDTKARDKVIDEIKRFNAEIKKAGAPGAAIRPVQLFRSRRTKEKIRRKTRNGVNIPKGYEGLVEGKEFTP